MNEKGVMSEKENRGGKRPGAGRKDKGWRRRTYYLTDAENEKVKEFVEELKKLREVTK